MKVNDYEMNKRMRRKTDLGQISPMENQVSRLRKKWEVKRGDLSFFRQSHIKSRDALIKARFLAEVIC
jgi:hypothetical protein